jgi:peptidoglycan/LPS O-acetylase OafA/YrhL
VLSGFVICISYSHKLQGKTQLYNFTIKRIGRIWPLHILMILALLAIELSKYYILANTGTTSESSAFIGRFSIESLVANVFLIHSLGTFDTLTWNNPSWSISVEFFTYIVFALIVFTFKSRLKALSIIIVASSLVALVLLAPKNMDVTYDYGLIRCLSGFFVGVFICLWRSQSLNINFNKGSVIELFVIVLVYLFISELGANKYSLLSPLVFGFAVWIFSYELGYISKILKHKFIQMLGVLSFTMYMIHSVILTVIWRVNTLLTKEQYIVDSVKANGSTKIMHFGNPYLGDLFLLCYIGFVITLSFIIYNKYEEPLRIKFNQFANRKF